MEYKISILIATLDERAGIFKNLKDELLRQILVTHYKVEILSLRDNREKTTGAKRNWLLNKAKGKYVVFIDDDDEVPDYYVKELLKAAESDADAFAINGIITTNGADEKKWDISKNNPYDSIIVDGKEFYRRYPNHITPIRATIAKMFKFPDIVFGEDYAWATDIHNSGLIKTEYKIDKPMYHYRYKTK